MKTLRIDATHVVEIGTPNARVALGSVSLLTHDDLGLPRDPVHYADRSCTTCNGLGTLTLKRCATKEETRARHALGLRHKIEERYAQKPVTPRFIDRMVEAAITRLARTSVVQSTQPCGCMDKLYLRARLLASRLSR